MYQIIQNVRPHPSPSPDFWTFRRLWISLGWKYIQFLENWPTTPPFWVKVQTRAKLIFSPLTLHFRCKEFRKSTFWCLPKLMLNYLYRQNVWNFSDTIIGHFLTRNFRTQIFETLTTLEFWYLLSLCIIFRQNGNRWPIVELFPVKNSNVESENCADSMSRLAIVKQPCQTELGFLGYMCIY